jgi:hypothetical protein
MKKSLLCVRIANFPCSIRHLRLFDGSKRHFPFQDNITLGGNPWLATNNTLFGNISQLG